jgi:type VI secretion system secreted protein VgrG
MTKRLLELEPTSLFGTDAILTNLSGRESLSSPFEFMLTIASPNDKLKPEQIIGKPLAVRINRDNKDPRYVHGYVSHFWAGNTVSPESGMTVFRMYRVQIVPWIWFMSRASRCFVYLPEKDEKSIQDILDEVVSRVTSYGHFAPELESENAKILAKRKVEHCVQYRETDLNFLSRTLERYGVYYYFKFENTKHTLVLSDELNYPNAPEAEVRFPASSDSRDGEDTISSWEHAYEFVTGQWGQTDYDFTHPSTDLRVNVQKHSSITINNNDGYEHYDSPGEYIKKGDGEAEAEVRLEAEESRFNTVTGSSICKTFSPGYCFKLTEHPNCKDEKGKGYLITSVSHYASQPGPFTSESDVATYSNTFSCIPRESQYRASRSTPCPIISSIQTAVVVGPPGEEIYTDKYGRVKVQFHWDRDGKRDENTSCWIRCRQSVAGNKWGFMALPRIGQEVVIEFIEGDPDRPLITGSVYNAEQMPHYALPADKAKSYIKTNSTPGGDGHNEIMFDDQAKAERLYLHAQRNMDVRVLNDSMERVFGNRHQIIGYEKDGKKGGDQRELIYEDKHLTVKRHTFEHVEGNSQLLIGEGEAKEGGNFDIAVEKQKSEMIGGDSHLIVKGKHSEKVDGNFSAEVGGNLHTKVNGNIAQEAGAMGEIHVKSGMKIILEAGMQLSIVGPGGFIDIGPAGVTIQGIMVKINSGGAKGSGSGCKPEKPKEPKKAKPAKPEIAHNSTSGRKSSKG